MRRPTLRSCSQSYEFTAAGPLACGMRTGREALLIFYATVVTVYSLLFIVLMVQLPAGSSSLMAMISPPSLPVRQWIIAITILGFYLTAGLVIPLAVLAGFLSDTTWWRALAFGVTTIQVFIAGGSCLLAAVHLADKAGELLAARLEQVTNTADNASQLPQETPTIEP